ALYSVEARTHAENSPAARYLLHDGAKPLAAGRVEGLVAGDYTIAVTVPGLGTRTRKVEHLLANETRALAFVFGPGAALAGRVVRPSGAPVANVPVLLLAPAAADDSADSFVLPRNGMSTDAERARHELARTRSDAHGAFRFELTAPGDYAL